MTREDIIRMAREAGFRASVGKTDKDGVYHPYINALSNDVPVEWLERFAALVAAAEREALIEMMPGGSSVDPQWVCDAIRARGHA